jgi:hypothetical protein
MALLPILGSLFLLNLIVGYEIMDLKHAGEVAM